MTNIFLLSTIMTENGGIVIANFTPIMFAKIKTLVFTNFITFIFTNFSTFVFTKLFPGMQGQDLVWEEWV
jgi:hypothetical protein